MKHGKQGESFPILPKPKKKVLAFYIFEHSNVKKMFNIRKGSCVRPSLFVYSYETYAYMCT